MYKIAFWICINFTHSLPAICIFREIDIDINMHNVSVKQILTFKSYDVFNSCLTQISLVQVLKKHLYQSLFDMFQQFSSTLFSFHQENFLSLKILKTVKLHGKDLETFIEKSSQCWKFSRRLSSISSQFPRMKWNIALTFHVDCKNSTTPYAVYLTDTEPFFIFLSLLPLHWTNFGSGKWRTI